MNVKTPTLILCDVGDYRVPITESYSFFRVLRDHNIVTQFIAYPVPGHFPSDPIRREDIYQRWIQWLGRYLPTAPGAEAVALPPTSVHPHVEATSGTDSSTEP